MDWKCGRQRLSIFWTGGCLLVGALIIGGCDLPYYSQAVVGHFEILNKKRKIDDLLKAPNTSPELKRKLELNQKVRQFAFKTLHLPESEAYTEYADIGRSYVTTLITASEPLKLKAYQWNYFFIGKAEYRGFFNDTEALAYAETLKKEGWDVSVGQASAYSTLVLNRWWIPDYFKDPVLNTFLDRSDTSIISTLIHEMAHQIVYVSGDTSFNESFAVFVEQQGLQQYLKENYPNFDQLYKEYEFRQADKDRFNGILSKTVDELNIIYYSSQSDFEKLLKKQQIFKKMKANYHEQAPLFHHLNYQDWFDQPLNNAYLLGVKNYSMDVGAFQRLFLSVGGQWEVFYGKVRDLAQLPKTERDQKLKPLLP